MKILIVEDDELVQRLYTRTVTAAGHEPIVINDGSIALQAAIDHKPGIILMDIMMPVLNGIEATKLLKANEATKNIPVIMLSANDDPSLMQVALEAGANRYLVKSDVEPPQIIAFIQETIAGSSS